MCGIAGIYKLNNLTTPNDIQAVRRMMDAQIHRGPDDSGLYHDKCIVFGHRRLSIIDLSQAGKQPMSNETCSECNRKNGKVWIVYNGEIYNFFEIYKSLIENGHKFRSNSDTEVILHGYVQWGIDGLLERLRGMFAFALYDVSPLTPHVSRLILVRDRLGIKPLYYYEDNESITFSSEVKAMIQSKLIPVERNPDADITFLLFGSVPEPLTTIRNVFSLPAGNYITIENGKKRLVKYYNLIDSFTKPTIDNYKNIFNNTRPILDETVNIHLISDAPLGLFLSGGIDSSALVSLASDKRDKPITTLSIIFDEEEYSELPYQRIIAKKYKTDHIEMKVTEKDFYDEINNIFEAMDQPTVDGVNTYFVSRAAKQAGLKAVLSGTGGDEIFCGYESFKRIRLLKFIYSLPKILKFPVALSDSLNGSWSKLSYLQNNDHLSLYLTLRGLFVPKHVARILDASESEVKNVLESFKLQTPDSELRTLDPIDWLSYMEMSFYLKNQLLKDTDFMSMYHSVETRVPYLDHKLVNYIASINPTSKTNKNIPKPLLIKSINHSHNSNIKSNRANRPEGRDRPDLLPNEIIFRRKVGFTFPFDLWMKKHGRRFFEESISKKNVDKRYAEGLWQKFELANLHWSKVWSLVVFGTKI